MGVLYPNKFTPKFGFGVSQAWNVDVGQIKRKRNVVIPRRRKMIRTIKLPDDDLINVKRRERRERSKNVGGHGASIEIPLDLYEVIMKADTFRKQLETHLDDQHTLAMLECFEDQISASVDYYKDIKVLPRGWKYDPTTTSTLVPKKSRIITDNDLIISDSPKRHGFSPPSYDPFDPDRKIPKTESVPLNEEEKKIWLQFLEFAKKTPALISISLDHSRVEKEKRPIPLDNPVVGLIGCFAVDTFNKAFEMLIKEGEHNRVNGIEFLKCTFIKMTRIYYFYLTIKAREEGNLGIYETKVKCQSDDGYRSLSYFVLTYPPSEGVDGCSESEDSEDDWSDQEDKLSIGGMELRRKDATCEGYDYHTPYGFDGP